LLIRVLQKRIITVQRLCNTPTSSDKYIFGTEIEEANALSDNMTFSRRFSLQNIKIIIRCSIKLCRLLKEVKIYQINSVELISN